MDKRRLLTEFPAPRCGAAPGLQRKKDAGVSLVEILVVLALLGVMAGAITLGLGWQNQDKSLQQEADLLMSRLHHAADHSLLTGQKMQLKWDAESYAFFLWTDGAWHDHPIGILAQPHRLSRHLRLKGQAGVESFVVGPDLIPEVGKPLTLSLQATDQEQALTFVFDGVRARVTTPGGVSDGFTQ